MHDTTGLQSVVGLLLLILAFGAGVFAWLMRELSRERDRAATLQGALGTIAGVCYILGQRGALRVDGHTEDTFWPLHLDTLLNFLDDGVRHDLDIKLRTLSATGAAFTQRVRLPGKDRQLELTGHRLTASRMPSLDLIWATDITEREVAAAARTQAEQDLTFLRTLVDRLPLAIWWRGDDLAATGGNRRFGQTPGIEAAGRPLAEAARRSGLPERAEHKATIGGLAHVFDVAELPLDAGGTIGFAIDRSETARLKAELERMAIVHQQVLEAVGSAVAIWGPDARLLFNNTAFARLWGLEQEWLSSNPSLSELLDTLHRLRTLPEYADFRQFKLEQLALFDALDAPRDELMHLPDNRTLRRTVTRHPFGGLTFAYEDVTDRLALERSYNTLAEVQRETLDNLFEAIAVFGSDGRLKLWNPTFGAMWQLTEAELAARPHISTLVEKARPLYRSDDWQSDKRILIERITGYAPSAEQITRRDGAVLEMNGVPLPDGNMLLTYRDVTDTARVQRALEDRNEALETATRLKSEFIANVSHELRTPLNAIVGFAEILTNQYFGPLNERQLDYSRGILDSSQRLMALINDILDLATIEAGQLTLDRQPVDIHTLLAGILALTRERAQRLEITLNFDCPTDIGMVMADDRRLRQTLFNLVSNAIKFTPAGGSVTLAARRVGTELALTVADSGVGIASDLLGKVFEKFERGDPSLGAVGAGLGLSLVKSFIELHGGRVELDSAPHQGTRVTCWLPAGARIPPARTASRRRTDQRPPAPPDHPTVQ